MKTCPACQASYPNSFAVCPQDGSALVELGAWSEGTVIRGKYRLLSKVGQGGMGAVYKALHLAFDEMRALKVMSPELMSDELFVKRFKHEAVITRRLQHPNAVRVDDIDEAEDGRPFIVMEYIAGQSLKKLIQDQGPLPVPRVCSIIKQAAAALEAAHRLGMVHRDIKPDNIALIETSDGEQAKVLDFGIAKVKEARLGGESSGMTLTGTGVVIGTPQYMSPEQAMGKRGDDLDGRSDIYSLGIVMYQMLTGDLPFKADTTMEMLLCHMQRAPTPIGSIRPELQIPLSIASLVMRCLEKQRDLRPASAKALIEEISRAEKESVPVGATRVIDPTKLVSPEVMGASQAAAAERGRVAGPTGEPGRVAVEPPRPSREKPPAPPRPPVQPPPARESRWGLWVSAIILVAGLGGTGWYFLGHRPTGSSGSTGQGDAAKVVEQMAKGDEYVKAGAYDSAIQEYQNGLNVDPSNATLRGKLILAHQARGDDFLKKAEYDNAINEYLSGQKLDPSNPTLTSKLEEAQKARAAAQARGPETPPLTSGTVVDAKKVDAAIRMGDFYLARRQYDAAVREYENGRKLDPSNSTLLSKLDQAQKAKAASVSRSSEVSQPPAQPAVDTQKVGAAIKMGDFYLDRGEYDNAIREYEKGLSLDPNNAELRSKLERVKKAKAAEGRVLQ